MTTATGSIQWEKLIVSDVSGYDNFTDVTLMHRDSTNIAWVLSYWHKDGHWNVAKRERNYHTTWWPVSEDEENALIMWVEMKGVLK